MPWEALLLSSQLSNLTAGLHSHAFCLFGLTKDPSLFIQIYTNSTIEVKNSETEMWL